MKAGGKTKRTDDPLVLVATAPNEPVAGMWAGILENEGIRSVTKGRDLRAAQYVPSLVSACDIYVLASQAERAKEVLVPFMESLESD